jgi:hypothetical protein
MRGVRKFYAGTRQFIDWVNLMKNRFYYLWLGGIATLVVASCASAPQQSEAIEQSSAVQKTGSVVFEEDELPLKSLGSAKEFFPASMKRQELVGRVLLAYSVNPKGQPKSMLTLYSDHKDFEKGAKEMLKNMRFTVPSDWAESSGIERRYRFWFIFEIAGKPKPPKVEDKVPSMVITARPIG